MTSVRAPNSASPIGGNIQAEPARLNIIFDEFMQLDNPERDRSKGLGLSIVRRIAALLG